MTNCKNCGAPVKSYRCEYCGTTYIEKGLLAQLEYGSKLLEQEKQTTKLYSEAIEVIRRYSARERDSV